MNSDQEQFQNLRRLLSVKRHETPPPGYFNNFSGEVMARIKAGERDQESAVASWVQKIWEAFTTRPAVAGAFGLATCCLLVYGVVSAASAGDGQASLAGMNFNNTDPSTQIVMGMADKSGNSAFTIPNQDGAGTISLAAAPGSDSLFNELQQRSPSQVADPFTQSLQR